MAELTLPAPIGLQPSWLESPASRKVLRVGRRGGKSRFAMIAGIAGHGPGEDGKRKFPGILEGVDVVWVAQDYPNLTTVMWREEFKPRFQPLVNAGLAKMNEAEHWINVKGCGTLFLRPSSAIRGIRGIGKNLKGVIIDEAAHLDLESDMLDVVLPALLDLRGWLILMSTTNAAGDGNSLQRVPSYFNMICQQIRAGERSSEWAEFTGTAFDSPAIDDAGIHELIAEYPPESPSLKQEVHAELLVAGTGLMLPMIDEAVHIVEPFEPPKHWRQFGAFDWGYNHPWVFGWYCLDEDGNIFLIDTVWGREDLPEAIGAKVEAAGVPVSDLRGIVAGLDIWQQKGRAVGFKGPTIADRLRREHGWSLIEADTQRVMGWDTMRIYLSHEGPSDDRPGGRPPRFRLMGTGITPARGIAGDGNRRVLYQLASLQQDPKNIEDALKMDADAAGMGGDDGADMTRYGCQWVRLGMKSAPVQKRPSVREMLDEAERAEHIDTTLEDRIANRLKRRNRRGGGGNGRVPLRVT